MLTNWFLKESFFNLCKIYNQNLVENVSAFYDIMVLRNWILAMNNFLMLQPQTGIIQSKSLKQSKKSTMYPNRANATVSTVT